MWGRDVPALPVVPTLRFETHRPRASSLTATDEVKGAAPRHTPTSITAVFGRPSLLAIKTAT